MTKFKLDEGLIITKDTAGENEVEGKKILYKPAWLWMLGK